jgi:polysaccharide chain length determinant protein (PEP-CTERM system associated)
LICAGVLCGVGWLVILQLPNQYEVTTKVFVDTGSLRKLLKGIAVSDNRKDNANMIRRTLLVRPNLEKVARQTDMDIGAKTPRDFEQLLLRLARSIRVKGSNKDDIYVIGYRSSDAKLATRVVEAILSIFVESSLGENRRVTSNSKEFLEEQIAGHEQRLSVSEARLKEFKRNNVGRMPSEGRTYFNRLQTLRRSLSDAELALREARKRVASIEQQLTNQKLTLTDTTDTSAAGLRGPLTPYDKRLAVRETNLDALLLQYTDQHPDVISTRRLIEELKAKRQSYLADLNEQTSSESPSQGAAHLMRNPLYRELTLAYTNATAEAAALETRVNEYKRREIELGALIDTIPQVEAELIKLNRNYNVIRKNYEKLVQRYEALKITDEAGQSNEAGQFNIIEPPRIPLVPVSPDRPKLSIMVLVVGLAGGVGLTILIALFRPAIYTRDALRDISDLPVFGAVSRLWTPRERFKRHMNIATFALGCLCLFAVFAGLMATYYLNINVDVMAQLERLSQKFL